MPLQGRPDTAPDSESVAYSKPIASPVVRLSEDEYRSLIPFANGKSSVSNQFATLRTDSKPEQEQDNMAAAIPQRPPLFVAQPPANPVAQRRIERVLIANRGEIACRIIATCQKLNLTSIAIYVDEDVGSLHVSQADEVVCLGSIIQSGGNPFLNIQYLVEVANSVRADAVHPGYGYLSENGAFAEAVRGAGLIFVGPSSAAITTLGDKRRSKEYLRKNAPSIPLVPGFAGSSQNVEDLEEAAEKIGYPVMVKASAGGGGKGMRIVRKRAKLRDELKRAQSEAQRSFGSSDCILEKYIESSKHIEVQILGDSNGKVISLWERECSVQRRHQKVIEETPSPYLTTEQRQRMCAAAVQLGELILYEGAGTVEFVVDAKTSSFYFLEVNTRLQVEHPITEEVTGLDIVALQLFVAARGKLSDIPQLCQIPQQGHAIECRLCAEDAANNFMPEKGTIELWKEAKLAHFSRDIRYETAVESGSTVSIYFDSMIAKVVVWAPTRDLAISKMSKVMANTACIGLKTNQLFLQSCLMHPAFRKPTYTTSLIPDNLDILLKNPYTSTMPGMTDMLAVVPLLMLRQNDSGANANDHNRKPFKNVRRAFRNQAFDPIDLSTTVVCPIDATTASQSLLCSWQTPNKDARKPTNRVMITPLPGIITPPDSKPTQITPAQDLTCRFAAISNHLRRQSPPSITSKTYAVSLHKLQSHPSTVNTNANATTMSVAIDDSLLQAHITSSNTLPLRSLSSSSSVSSFQSLKCHFPALGTWIEYRVFSLLSYFEKLRDDVAANANAATKGKGERTIRAPMPCKVLSILKHDGEVVKVGQVVMVIESMKMETSITAAVEGTVRMGVKRGDAVEDGKMLCWIE